ncbi:molybdopterin molybdotransferase MoeA [Haloarchaeobius sp. HRN-SO-5]|uniref:molybdopterin molybdotransferase MoeA n=1 Tax=Haloarchaeobius sp. HRN-SO-5 TaxID=3446118 RepID=UPI003EBFA2EA
MTTTDPVPLATALDDLHRRLRPVERTESVSLPAATGRVLAESVTATRSIPHYRRAAMDGYAVRADDTAGARTDAPASLRLTEGRVGSGEAVPVHTGSELPDGADAVVRVERTVDVDDGVGVTRPVAAGKDVAPVGEDVTRGTALFDPGHRLGPADAALLKSVGTRSVTVYGRPTVAVLPTGEELVQSDPAPGEVVETNGLTVSTCVREWGGDPTYGDVVPDDHDALAAAVEEALDHDVVVTTGGSSVGDRDLVPDVVDDLGSVFVHGVSIRPGHPVALGVVDDTPVLLLPGYPVSCIVTAVQFLRPAVKAVGRLPLPEFPTVEAELTEPIDTDPGVRRFARATLDTADGRRVVRETRTSGASILSSVALTDGWVVVPEDVVRLDAGTTVEVQRWE